MEENLSMNGQSKDIRQEKLNQLKQILPEVFTEEKVDVEKLKNFIGEDLNINNERYVLNWAGKSDAIKTLQTPTTATLEPCKKESIDFDTTQNIFIEGENLEVLKTLQKSYYGKIKMIYIDPPYNTGNDSFVYNDHYVDSEDNYRHSKWLSFMEKRMKLSKNLLKKSGVVFISINDIELSQLKLLCDEIFGSNNFVANLIWENKEGGGSSDSKNFRIKHEYILVYAKDISVLEIAGVGITNEVRYTGKDEYFETRGKYYLQKLNH